MSTLSVVAPDGVGEVRRGDDLVALLVALVELRDGDIVAVTSKVVSKAEGRVRAGTREESLPAESARVVARRGPTVIVRTHLGVTLAAAGIDASNVEAGSVVLLPVDPDASARALREGIRARTGRNVGVVVTDTAGRAWREGQTDIAIGAAGLHALEDHTGRVDAHGNTLAVTAPAVADEIAGAAELAQGKLGGRPFALVRGRADLVLAPDDHGPGARALVRPEGADLFGFGAREAVVRAVLGAPADLAPFGEPAGAHDLATVLRQIVDEVVVEAGELTVTAPGTAVTAVAAVAFAHGWQPSGDPGMAKTSGTLRLRPATT